MRYYVVFKTEKSVGACTIDLKLPVRKIDDVRLMADSIKEIQKTSSVVILNWKELEEEEDEEIHQD